MDLGIVLGAITASALAGRYAPLWKGPARSLIAAVAGGPMLGYGARLAYGCNISAYFSGIVSGSLHGWLWLVAAFAGNALGTRLRPLFGLEVERIRQSGCQGLFTDGTHVCSIGKQTLERTQVVTNATPAPPYL